MATALETAAIHELDFLLEGITEDLQLTKTQYENAAEKYRAVGNWLQAPGSALASLAPQIYPQGSMALQTTVKPIRQLEYDLDLVCQVISTELSAMQLYDLLHGRVVENDLYKPKVEKLKRCVRINYAEEFHLDVIPAQPDETRPEPCVLVPDRRLKDWTPSNPLGFIAWFKSRAVRIAFRRALESLPPQEALLEKTTLSVAVQLIKRRRDISFGTADDAPRSILLTTLAGLHYEGEQHIAHATLGILSAIEREIDAHSPRRIDVRNPMNPDESFSESFTPDSYRAFATFIRKFRAEMAELLEVRGGFVALQEALEEMFGPLPVQRAFRAYGERLKNDRKSGLRFGPAAGIAFGGGSPKHAPHVVPPTHFYGE